MKWGDGNKSDGRQRDRLSGFSISVFGRFTYTLSALEGHYLVGFDKGVGIGGNVRPNQTACSRTAGHLISEKPESLPRCRPSDLLPGDGDGGLLFVCYCSARCFCIFFWKF